jgi:hypothetical protein
MRRTLSESQGVPLDRALEASRGRYQDAARRPEQPGPTEFAPTDRTSCFLFAIDIEDSPDVSRTVQNPDEFNAVVECTVEEEIALELRHGDLAKPSQFGPVRLMSRSNSGGPGDEVEGLVNGAQESIRDLGLASSR